MKLRKNSEKRRLVKMCVVVLMVSDIGASAYAQNSVTLYGIADFAFRYQNSVTGGSSKLDNFSGTPSRWGLSGVEDLGGGMKAVFRLENGFNLATGALQQGGREFGRQAYLGLQSTQFGSILLGRQYDLMTDYLQPLSAVGTEWAGGEAAHFGDLDNVQFTFRVNNAVKYNSPLFYGLRFSALYSFGGVAGHLSENSLWNIATSYSSGPITLAAAYYVINNPINAVFDGNPVGGFTSDSPYVGLQSVGKQKIAGAGAGYTFGSARLQALFTNVHLEQSELAKGNATYSNYEINFQYTFVSQVTFGASYFFTDGHWETGDQHPKYHQVNLGGVYAFSKATDTYIRFAYQHAAGDAKFAQIVNGSASATRNQMVVLCGITHRF